MSCVIVAEVVVAAVSLLAVVVVVLVALVAVVAEVVLGRLGSGIGCNGNL